MEFLFTVVDRFAIEGRGVVLVPGIPHARESSAIRKGAAVRLRKPDLTQHDTEIRDLEMLNYRPNMPLEQRSTPILLPKDIHKFDVPIGTEVYLLDEETQTA